ncbi:hypothetical protein [Oceanobacillus rekensis]|uniref:hypothetical protein n=1 Tax=Oceanobacillus rekensis TaxID=937927 RepID=UPI000B44B80B|nr:hypothetical protein [Oceanobacillus rekensis]
MNRDTLYFRKAALNVAYKNKELPLNIYNKEVVRINHQLKELMDQERSKQATISIQQNNKLKKLFPVM